MLEFKHCVCSPAPDVLLLVNLHAYAISTANSPCFVATAPQLISPTLCMDFVLIQSLDLMPVFLFASLSAEQPIIVEAVNLLN